MRLRVCSLLLLFMALLIEATNPQNSGFQSTKPFEPKKILIYNPYLGYHHMHFMTTIANALDIAGHEVTMLDSEIYTTHKQPKRRKTIKTRKVNQNPKTADVTDAGETQHGLMAFWTDFPIKKKFDGFFSFYKPLNGFSTMVTSQCEDLLASPAFDEIKKSSYDLAITEVFDFCGVGLTSIINVKKTILASSVPLHEYIGEKLGLPKTFDIVPTKFSMSTAYEHRETFEEYNSAGLYKNIFESALMGQNIFGYLEKDETEIFKKDSSSFPGFEELLRRSYSLIENVHPLMDLNKPTLNAIIPLGGITLFKTENELYSVEEKKEIALIDQTISNAKMKNFKVVLVSFGTVMNTKSMTDEVKKNLITAFMNVQNTEFIWKADEKLLPVDRPSNVHVHKWLPQNDLLASGKIDLFVTHMGIGSMTEAAYHGVPMIAVPIFVDQHYNYVCAKRLGIANFVDKNSLDSTHKDLSEAIQKGLDDRMLKTNSTLLASNLYKFGNQTKRMMDHINFILSLPDESKSIAFRNHHHGLNLMLGVRSLLHLFPYYAVPITIMLVFIAVIYIGYIFWWIEYFLLFRQHPQMETEFGTIALRSLRFYFSMFVVLALSAFSFPFLVVMVSDNFPTYSTQMCTIIFVLLAQPQLNWFSPVRALSHFTTCSLSVFSAILVVLWFFNLLFSDA